MFQNCKNLFLILCLVSATAVLANAQRDATNDSGTSAKEEMPSGIKESLAKQRIDREKKDFQELLERGEEALKITDQLEKSYSQNKQFSLEDQKKLDRLEKVVKKIRNEMGGDGDEQEDDKPLSVASALENLKTGTTNLLNELKKTSRYSVSVVAVQSSNTLLKIVQFLRLRSN